MHKEQGFGMCPEQLMNKNSISSQNAGSTSLLAKALPSIQDPVHSG